MIAAHGHLRLRILMHRAPDSLRHAAARLPEVGISSHATSIDQRIAELARGFGLAGTLTIARAANGKPYLFLDGHPAGLGLGLSHARVGHDGYTAIAILAQRDIGIDIENMDQPATGSGFLASIACSEDRRACQQLSAAGLDPGRCLWCLKEAALKCSGEAMTDPRDLAVRQRGGLWQVRPSRQACAPTPDIDLGLFSLTSSHGNRLLLAIGAGADIGDDLARTLQDFLKTFQTDNPSWRIAALAG